MLCFREWLFIVEGRAEVPPGVLQGYEHAFKDELQKLITRTRNASLKAVLIDMLDCPVRDSRGQCRGFAEYILSALIKNGVHRRYDLEAALHYVVEKMLMPVGDSGEPRLTVFQGFEERPDQTPDFNPVQARFMGYLQFAVNNIRKGRIPRLANAESRPAGTVSIGQGRHRPGDPAGGVSPDEIAAPRSGEGDLAELVADIEGLLRRREGQAGFPLVSLFKAIMGGMTLEEQRARFGDRRVRAARQVIVATIAEYAEASGNAALLHLLARMTGEVETPRRAAVPAARPVVSDKERDYRSIADVVARFERPVGTADLGRYRRRWLEYQPRQTGSGYRNRLEEVLAAMVADGVLRATRTAGGATVYGAGERFEAFRGVGAGG